MTTINIWLPHLCISSSLNNWEKLKQPIVVGTREQMPGCGQELKGPKDYEIQVTPNNIVVCGFDQRGAMFGLYNLESRMNLREAPFLPQERQKQSDLNLLLNINLFLTRT